MSRPNSTHDYKVREATLADLPAIQRAYNEGIEDRIATLDLEPKDDIAIGAWFAQHSAPYVILVAEERDRFLGWASLNPYSAREAYRGVADLSVYVSRACRGMGVGRVLLEAIELQAVQRGFHKIVLFTFPFNKAGQSLYRGCGFQEVGVFYNHGRVDGGFVDVMAMEKILR